MSLLLTALFFNAVSKPTTSKSDVKLTPVSLTPETWNDYDTYNNSKKGTTAISDGDNSRVYTVSITNSSTGRKLAIKSYYDDVSGGMTGGQTFYPKIPYRFMCADKEMRTPIGKHIKNQPIGTGTDLLFNPGITRVGGSITYPSYIDSDSSKFWEINLLREEFEALKNKKFKVQYGQLSDVPMYVTYTDVRAYDVSASIIARPHSTTPSTHDTLYVSVTSRVQLKGTYEYAGISTKNLNIYYTIPIVLKLSIPKPGTSGRDITPDSWSYPLDDTWYSGDKHEITKINTSLSYSYESNLCNYNILPGATYAGGEDRFFWPISWGCLSEIEYDENNAVLRCVSSVGNYYKAADNKSQHPYRHYGTVCVIPFSSSSFVAPTFTSFLNNSPKEHQLPMKIDMSQYSDVLAISVDYNYGNSDKTLTMFLLKNSYNFQTVNLSTTYLSSGKMSSVQFIDGRLFLRWEVERGFAIHKFDTINTTTSNFYAIGRVFTTRDRFRNALNTFGAELWTEWDHVTPTPSYEQNYDIAGAPVPTLLDLYSHDKSIHSAIWESYKYTYDYNLIPGVSGSIIHTHIRYDAETYSQKLINKSTTENNTDTNRYGWSGITSDIVFPATTYGFTGSSHLFISMNKSLGKLSTATLIAPEELTLGPTCVAQYWQDPVFGYGDRETRSDENAGIDMILSIVDCSGIRSSTDPFTTSAWDSNLQPMADPNNHPGGIKINYYARPDLTWSYAGDKDDFIERFSTWYGGYWATCDQPAKVTFTNSEGNNLIYDNPNGDAVDAKWSAWRYRDDGIFNLYVSVKLDLSNAGSSVPFTDPTFVLNDCKLKINLINKFGLPILSEKEYTLDLDPPNGSGIIDSTLYKSIGDIPFEMSRIGDQDNQQRTEIHDVSRFIRNADDRTNNNPTVFKYGKDNNTNTATITYKDGELGRGDYAYIRYVPKLQGVKPVYSPSTQVSKFVTYCKGHKYSIDNVELKMGSGVAYGDDLISSIRKGSPYFYVDTASSNNIKVTLDVNHEDWSDGSDRDSYSDINVYPGISGIYIMAIGGLLYGTNIGNDDNNFEEFIPYKRDEATAYPNVKSSIGSTIKRVSEMVIKPTSTFTSGIYLPGTSASLSSQDIIVSIDESANYRVYIAVEDEYEQFSSWCITNSADDFKHPRKG